MVRNPSLLTSHTSPLLHCSHPLSSHDPSNALHAQRAISLAPPAASSLPVPVSWGLCTPCTFFDTCNEPLLWPAIGSCHPHITAAARVSSCRPRRIRGSSARQPSAASVSTRPSGRIAAPQCPLPLHRPLRRRRLSAHLRPLRRPRARPPRRVSIQMLTFRISLQSLGS